MEDADPKEVDFFSKAYDILVKYAGAYNGEKNFEKFNFVASHLSTDKYPASEYRFCGKLGFGGKYWKKRNAVSAYSEDDNTETQNIINITNKELKLLKESLNF